MLLLKVPGVPKVIVLSAFNTPPPDNPLPAIIERDKSVADEALPVKAPTNVGAVMLPLNNAFPVL